MTASDWLLLIGVPMIGLAVWAVHRIQNRHPTLGGWLSVLLVLALTFGPALFAVFYWYATKNPP